MTSPLREIREQATPRLTRAALGARAGVHPGIIVNIERGVTRNPTGRTLFRLAGALTAVLGREVHAEDLLPAEAPDHA